MLLLICLFGPPDAVQEGLTLVQKQGGAEVWLVSRSAEPFSLPLTEKCLLVLRLEGQSPLEVELIRTPPAREGWLLEALGKPTTAPLDGGKRTRWQQTYQAVPLKPGSDPLQMPGLKWTEKDGPEQSVTWEPLAFKITTSIARADVSELREHIEIEELPPATVAPRPFWPWLFAILPATAVLGFAMMRARRRATAPLSARVEALKTLDKLEERLRSPGISLSEWQAGLAEAIRRYLEQHFSWPASRRTTTEFLSAPGLPLSEEHVTAIAQILRLCDLAKFAGLPASLDAARHALSLARSVVEQTSAPVIR